MIAKIMQHNSFFYTLPRGIGTYTNNCLVSEKIQQWLLKLEESIIHTSGSGR